MKKLYKKIVITLFLTATMLIVFALNAGASYSSGQCGDKAYWNIEGTKMTITGEGELWNVSKWEDYDTNIAKIVVSDVYIDEGISKLPESIFSEFGSLVKATLPDTLQSISKYAFYSCKSLTQVSIGKGVLNIDTGAFWYCTSLNSISLPVDTPHI